VFPAAKWAPPAVARSACCASPAAAVELELARAAALEQLRSKYASLCAKAGLRNAPLLSFERWRFAAKWAEEEPQRSALAGKAGTAGGGGGGTQRAKGAAAAGLPGTGSGGGKRGKAASSNTADPVLPYGSLPPAAEPGLVADLLRSGLAEAAATGVAQQLAQASQEACARLAKRRHQLASGAPPSCPKLQLAFHRHSMDLTCGSRFVKANTRPCVTMPFVQAMAACLCRLSCLCWRALLAGVACKFEQPGGAAHHPGPAGCHRLPCFAPSNSRLCINTKPLSDSNKQLPCLCLPRSCRQRSTESWPACIGHTGWKLRVQPPALPTAALGWPRKQQQPGWQAWMRLASRGAAPAPMPLAA